LRSRPAAPRAFVEEARRAEPSTYDYAVIRRPARRARNCQRRRGRLVPRQDFEADRARRGAGGGARPDARFVTLRAHLDSIPRICAGGAESRADRPHDAARMSPVAHRAAQRGDPVLCRAHRTQRRSGGAARPPRRHHGARAHHLAPRRARAPLRPRMLS
jgi:hypothetical protein